MLLPIGLVASMFLSMAGFILLCWIFVSVADLVLRFLGYPEPLPRRVPRPRYQLANISSMVSASAGDLVYASGRLFSTPFDPFVEVTVASLREELALEGPNAPRARFDAEGKFLIEPSRN